MVYFGSQNDVFLKGKGSIMGVLWMHKDDATFGGNHNITLTPARPVSRPAMVVGGHLLPQLVEPHLHNTGAVDPSSITPHLTGISLDDVYRCLLRDPPSGRHASPPPNGSS
jgi:hypothetical protein